ncbi:TIGR03826 family flagellar region protein [Paenibacillus sediminis]|uniref:Flagellar operon protein (TIGR03826 family) n=1 Tax=Paenibacillus sediminis TaxID=664909 RepID=A0ABS4H2H6_9BACL|nr:TIGR03826 family flagellar region protein [Paenibacillus sediminis]MBP1936666.1 flagellar operon protein (TIGR03826 family) [Paenibacillus sediminis]
MDIGNCPRCGRLFALNFRDICGNCIKEIEVEYEKCADYLREHRTATLLELSEATGVTTKQITRFVREGRISVVQAPNLMYPCEVCGTLIREGTMCDSCRTRLTKDLTSALNDSQSFDKGNVTGHGAYSALDRRKN